MATPPTTEQRAAIKAVADAIIEAVRAADPTIGAPGGVIYAALMGHGCSLERYESFMSALVRTGKLTKRGECYFVKDPVERDCMRCEQTFSDSGDEELCPACRRDPNPHVTAVLGEAKRLEANAAELPRGGTPWVPQS
jgi:hypothetical protein